MARKETKADMYARLAAETLDDFGDDPKTDAVVYALLSISHRLAELPDPTRELDLIDDRLLGIAENLSTIAYRE